MFWMCKQDIALMFSIMSAPTFLFLTSSPCRWLICRKEPLALRALTGRTARTGLRGECVGLETPLISSMLSNRPLMLLLLWERDLKVPLSEAGVLSEVRAWSSPWELALKFIALKGNANQMQTLNFEPLWNMFSSCRPKVPVDVNRMGTKETHQHAA